MASILTTGIGSSRVRDVSAQERAHETYDVLILDAGSRQSLASARSLGRAGLRVALAECFAECDPSLPVLAFRSRYSAHSVVLPHFVTDPAAFGAAIVSFVREHPTSVILPASDGSIAAVLPERERLASLGCRLALPSTSALEIANNKDRTLEVARRLGIEQPKTVPIFCLEDIGSLPAEIEFPFVLKPVTSRTSRSTNRLSGHRSPRRI
jgi:predicted ATP-grasp superfamily ATP-dependent carboligase